MLEKGYNTAEIKEIFCSIDGDKALGTNGYGSKFFKNCGI